ncbi:MAG: nucleoside deaminase [Pseudomonadota bacterium]
MITVDEPWLSAMTLAWEAHRSGNIGVGAVVTDGDGRIVARGRNRTVDSEAPAGRLHGSYLAHAEVDALTQLGHGDHEQHTLWTTLEPCLLCAAAAVLSHVGEVRFAAADPLWSGIERMPELNAQVARRWPQRIGPIEGPVARFCALLPLVWVVKRRTDGVVIRAYETADPDLLTLSRSMVRQGSLDRLADLPLTEALGIVWPQLA